MGRIQESFEAEVGRNPRFTIESSSLNNMSRVQCTCVQVRRKK